MSVRSRSLSVASAVALALGAAPQVFAQASTAQPESGAALEEVTVTAQKREEKLQDVPIAITAFSAEQITARGIQNILDLSALSPNVQISTATGDTTGTQFSIRGAATINPALYWDPTVGIYLDGVYVSKGLGSVFDLVDLERIEVLRGPQGTLYGRNTLAGAVNLVTRQPSGNLSGYADLSYGNYNDVVAKASLDLPKLGIASMSFGFRSETRDGITRTTSGSSVPSLDNRDQTGARYALNLDFSDTFQAAYRFDYSNINQRPLHSFLYRVDAPISFFPFVPGVTPIGSYVTKTDPGVVSIDGATFEQSKVVGHGLTLRWDLDAHTQLKSISAFRQLTWNDSLDLDGSPLPLADTQRYSKYHNESEELQLVGSGDRFKYVAGLYWFKDDGNTYNPQTFFGGTFNYDSRYGYATDAYAAYGQVDWKATDQFTVTGGLRFTSEKKSLTRSLGVDFAPGTPFLTLIPAGTSASKTFNSVTPLITLAYKFTPELNAYLKYSEGYKSGGFNGEFGNPDPSPAGVAANVAETKTPFNPEKDKTVELGLKSTLDDGRLTLNADVFYNKITDEQISVFLATGAASSVIRNAGKGNIIGFEFEGAWKPVDMLRLQLNYGYMHSKYDEFIDDGVNVAANRAFVHTPENTFDFLIEARLAETSVGKLYANLDYAWTDKYYDYPFALKANYPGDPDSNPATSSFAGDTQIKAVGFLNGRVSLREIPVAASTAEVSIYGRNLTNEKHIENNIDFGAGFGHLTPVYYSEPLTYGVELKVRW